MAKKDDLLAEAQSLGINDVDEDSSNSDIQARIDEENQSREEENQDSGNAEENDSEKENDYDPVQHQVGSGGDVNLNPDRPSR